MMLHQEKELPNDSGRPLLSFNNLTDKSKMAATEKQCFFLFVFVLRFLFVCLFFFFVLNWVFTYRHSMARVDKWLNKYRKKYTSGPRYWNVPVLVNTGTFLVYQYCPKMWYLRSLEHASVIQKLTILEHKNGLVLSNTRVPVSGT